MTDVECVECGHVRETTEETPTLVACRNCGSFRLRYTPGEAVER